MRVILTLIYAVLVIGSQALPAGASLHAAMYCWVPDFEIAVACDGDDALRASLPAGNVKARSSGMAAPGLGSERP
jgi:hypothetical protein